MFHPHNLKDSSINWGGECWWDKQIRLHHKKMGRTGGKLTQILYHSSHWKLEKRTRERSGEKEGEGQEGEGRNRAGLCCGGSTGLQLSASAHKSNEREKDKHLSWPVLINFV